MMGWGGVARAEWVGREAWKRCVGNLIMKTWAEALSEVMEIAVLG